MNLTQVPISMIDTAASDADKVLTSNGSTLSWAAAIPAGATMFFAMSSAPTGWLECNGVAVPREGTYNALFLAIGIIYGAGDGSTTFNLPDLRGEFIRGWAGSRAVDTGRVFGSAQTDLIENHTHTVAIVQGISSGSTPAFTGGGFNSGTTTTSNPTTNGGSETRPRNVALLPCIKF